MEASSHGSLPLGFALSWEWLELYNPCQATPVAFPPCSPALPHSLLNPSGESPRSVRFALHSSVRVYILLCLWLAQLLVVPRPVDSPVTKD